MRIRNKKTGQIFDVVAGTLYPSFFEEVKDEDILVGDPKVEYEIEKPKEDPKPKKPAKVVKKTKKGAKKNATSRK